METMTDDLPEDLPTLMRMWDAAEEEERRGREAKARIEPKLRPFLEEQLQRLGPKPQGRAARNGGAAQAAPVRRRRRKAEPEPAAAAAPQE